MVGNSSAREELVQVLAWFQSSPAILTDSLCQNRHHFAFYRDLSSQRLQL